MIHFIENGFIRVGIKQKGAELASIVDLKNNQEYMWEADPAYWGRHSSILFPIIGRVEADRILIEGKSYPMKQHGFARNTDFDIKQQNSDNITFQLENTPESLAIFPYQFALQAQYHLEGHTVYITYRVLNQDQQIIHFSLGAHPAFKCPLYAGEERSDYNLVFEKEETADSQLIENGLRTGETELVLQTEKVLPITDNLFDEDALIFEQLQSNFVTLAHKNGKEILKFGFKGFPYLGIWSKNSESPFVCIEPWHGVADRVNADWEFKNKEGTIALKKGENFECVHSVEIL